MIGWSCEVEYNITLKLEICEIQLQSDLTNNNNRKLTKIKTKQNIKVMQGSKL